MRKLPRHVNHDGWAGAGEKALPAFVGADQTGCLRKIENRFKNIKNKTINLDFDKINENTAL